MAEQNTNVTNTSEQQELGELLQIRRDKLKALQDEGRDPFQITKFDVTHHAQDIKDNFDALEGTPVRVAGRLMSKRGMGKVSFCDMQDKSGRIQIYARKDEMDEDNYDRFKKYDIGDIVGVIGEVFRTQRGEMSVRAHEIILLSKSLRPLPEKFHGLTDKEVRYRQRYVDLIMNPESKRNFEIRSKFVSYLRRYLDSLGFMEVETPVLSPIAGGANARPFITHHNAQDIDMYMRIATELHLKRLIVGGLERVYEVGRIFRNEGMDTKHNPEFTTCELYQAYTNLDGMMDILEAILSGACKEIHGGYQVQWLGHDIDLTPGWPRVTMADAVKNVTGADFMAIEGDDDAAVELAKSVGVDMDGVSHTWGNALYEAFDQKRGEEIQRAGGPEHIHRRQQGDQVGADAQYHPQAVHGTVGEGGVNVHPPRRAPCSHRCQQQRDHQRCQLHFRLHRACSPRAASSPAVTDSREESHTDGRISRGAAQP